MLFDPSTLAQGSFSSGLSSVQFQIPEHAKGVLMKVFTNDLYKDTTKFLYELIANGIDAGDPRPRVIFNPLENWVQISDLGCGMTREFLATRYVNLFDSTKNTDADSIGGFGIGRLSALAVADSYTIKTVPSDGSEPSHVMVFLDKGIPSLTFLPLVDMPKKGTVIRIPLSSRVNISKIERAVHLVQELFFDDNKDNEVLFTFKGDFFSLKFALKNLPDFPSFDYRHFDPGVFMRINGYPYTDQEIFRILNRVKKHLEWRQPEKGRLMLIVEAPNGTFEIPKSRDYVKWTKATEQMLLTDYQRFNDELKENPKFINEWKHKRYPRPVYVKSISPYRKNRMVEIYEPKPEHFLTVNPKKKIPDGMVRALVRPEHVNDFEAAGYKVDKNVRVVRSTPKTKKVYPCWINGKGILEHYTKPPVDGDFHLTDMPIEYKEYMLRADGPFKVSETKKSRTRMNKSLSYSFVPKKIYLEPVDGVTVPWKYPKYSHMVSYYLSARQVSYFIRDLLAYCGIPFIILTPQEEEIIRFYESECLADFPVSDYYKNCEEELYKRYPLLKKGNFTYYDLPNVKEYMRLMDKEKKYVPLSAGMPQELKDFLASRKGA